MNLKEREKMTCKCKANKERVISELLAQGFEEGQDNLVYTAEDGSFWLNVDLDDYCYVTYLLDNEEHSLDDLIPYDKIVDLAVDGVVALIEGVHPKGRLLPVCQL